MELFNYLILFLSAFLGGTAIFIFKKGNTKNLKLLLSFSGAYLFAITVLHLIPDVYEGHNKTAGLFILLGFGLQIFLEQFSEGIEHGHIHKHSHAHVAFPYGIMFSLCLHAFLEGMPLIAQHDHQHEATNPLLYGIVLHHIPAAFALGSVLIQSNLSKRSVIIMLAIFAIMTPLGSLLSKNLQANQIGNISHYFDYFMGIVIGIFLHISTTILFESSEDHRFNLYKMITIILGAGIAIVMFL
jgi:zinc and cadmium transporter